jgi:ABC-type lipopolysaccharide export system ATPase subunit
MSTHRSHTGVKYWVQNNSIFLELVGKQLNIFRFNRKFKKKNHIT